MSQNRLDRLQSLVLDRIERAERNYRAAFWSAVALEALFLVGFLALADFSNRMHVLVLLSAVGVYTTLILGLIALGAHGSRCTERVLKAIDLSSFSPEASTLEEK